jgi:uncharacterized protein YdaU (DUF1376 family)
VETALLTPEQKGALADLKAHAWAGTAGGPPCSLPDDDAILAKLAGMPLARWRKVGGPVRAQLETVEDNGIRYLRHAHQYAEYADMMEHRERRSKAGQRGNAVRWGPSDGSQCESQSDRNASRNAMAIGSPALAQAKETATATVGSLRSPTGGAVRLAPAGKRRAKSGPAAANGSHPPADPVLPAVPLPDEEGPARGGWPARFKARLAEAGKHYAYGQVGRMLAEPVAQYGEDALFAALDGFLRLAESAYGVPPHCVTLAKFAEHAGRWVAEQEVSEFAPKVPA